jgi:hypothetical protein
MICFEGVKLNNHKSSGRPQGEKAHVRGGEEPDFELPLSFPSVSHDKLCGQAASIRHDWLSHSACGENSVRRYLWRRGMLTWGDWQEGDL